MYTHNIITEKRLLQLKEIREKMREEHFQALIPQIGAEAADALRELYSLFTADMLIWFAGLWEPEIGGFYFSESGRDTEGLLPDVESTAQAMSFIEAWGCGKMPERFARKMGEFALGLQDEDGYFYHPQWGKNIKTSRRGRDLGWAKFLLEEAGMKPAYPYPMERKGEEGTPTLPEYLRSLDAYRAYLDSLPLTEKTYWVGNEINAQARQILGAGPEYVAAAEEWIRKYQREDNGLWQPEVNYASVNGLMKLALTYRIWGIPMTRAEQALKSAMTAAMSDEKIMFCCQFYNPWSAISGLLAGMEQVGEKEKAAGLRASLRENAADVIRVTARKMRTTVREDGAFAYNSLESGNTCAVSQWAPVALGVSESDINGTACSVSGPLGGIFSAFGVPRVPLFTAEDGEFLFELMDARIPMPKIHPLPEKHKDLVILPQPAE